MNFPGTLYKIDGERKTTIYDFWVNNKMVIFLLGEKLDFNFVLSKNANISTSDLLSLCEICQIDMLLFFKSINTRKKPDKCKFNFIRKLHENLHSKIMTILPRQTENIHTNSIWANIIVTAFFYKIFVISVLIGTFKRLSVTCLKKVVFT